MLAGANSLIAVDNGVVRLAGPPLGAVLLTWFGLPTVVLIDLASYLVSAAAITMTTRRAVRAGIDSAHRVSGILAELVAGLRFVARHRTLRGLLLVSTIFFSANAVFTALLIPFMTVRFGDHPGVIGAQLSALGAGYLIGGPLAGRLVRDRAPRLPLVLGLVGVGVCFVVLANAPSVLVAVVATGAAGLPGSLLLVTIETAIQHRSPDSLRGRTGAVFFASDALAALVGALVGAVFGGDGRSGTVLTTSAGVIALCAVLAAAIVPVPTFFSAEFAAQRPGFRSVPKSPGPPGI
jgi:predicted MFS family arabinose efflux permease